MSMKRWVLGKVNGTGARTGRPARGRAAPSLDDGAPAGVAREPTMGRSGQRQPGREAATHLGPYAPLIGAIREALEHFAASQLRLHLAIADRDRYILTSIEVECEGGEDDRALLRRFVTEFKPEQIKHYLARDVIAGLRNASAIDLSQFAGLNAVKDATLADEDADPYEDLLADLRSGSPEAHPSPYEVSLLGRWSQTEALPARSQPHEHRRTPGRPQAIVHTPLAARALTLDVEDMRGARRVELDSVVEGRRYVIGKDEACDVVVEGRYASRRHCEIWLHEGAWWVTDAGSTNGIRIESGAGALRAQSDRATPLELRAGETLVLSAHAQGGADQYPRLVLRPAAANHVVAPPAEAATAVPVTPIAPPRVRQRGLTIAAHMRSGVCEAELIERALPFFIGRSRNQALVIDGTYADVSGRHLEIVAVDEAGASVVVHGDNGVSVGGTAYACGERFHWKAGQTMLLGRPDLETSGCTLTLSRTT